MLEGVVEHHEVEGAVDLGGGCLEDGNALDLDGAVVEGIGAEEVLEAAVLQPEEEPAAAAADVADGGAAVEAGAADPLGPGAGGGAGETGGGARRVDGELAADPARGAHPEGAGGVEVEGVVVRRVVRGEVLGDVEEVEAAAGVALAVGERLLEAEHHLLGRVIGAAGRPAERATAAALRRCCGSVSRARGCSRLAH